MSFHVLTSNMSNYTIIRLSCKLLDKKKSLPVDGALRGRLFCKLISMSQQFRLNKCGIYNLLNFFEVVNWRIDNKCVQIKITLKAFQPKPLTALFLKSNIIPTEPIEYGIESLELAEAEQVQMRYQKYQKEKYIPQPHYKRENRCDFKAVAVSKK